MLGNRVSAVETLTGTRTIAYVYDPLNRLTASTYSTGEQFAYTYDAAGNRAVVTETTPISGTVVTTYTFDALNRLTDRQVNNGWVYTYTWSARGQMLEEWTQGQRVRTFAYDAAGRMTEATVFTLTTRFRYNGDGARLAVEVVGQGTTTYTIDYAGGYRVLAEETLTETVSYLYGHDCLGEQRDDEWLYYLNDAAGYVRQGAGEQGQVESAWLFDPDGLVIEGPQGLVSHLVCGGVYDWSTGLLFKGNRYFDPTLGIWLSLTPLVVLQGGKKGKKRRWWYQWVAVLLLLAGIGGMLVGCAKTPPPKTTQTVTSQVCTVTSTPPATPIRTSFGPPLGAC